MNSSIAIGSTSDIYCAAEDGFLYAIDPNGTEIWRYAANGTFKSPALGNDDTIYIGSTGGTLYAIDPNSSIKWTYTIDSPVIASLAAAGDIILVGSTNGTLHVIDSDGNLVWTFSSNHPESIVAGSSIGPNGTIYIGRLHDPNLYVLNPTDGSILWSTDLSHRIIPDNPATNLVHTGFQIAPVVHPDGFVLAAPTHNYKLYAMVSSSGDILWSCNLYHLPQKPPGSTASDSMYQLNYGYSDIWSERSMSVWMICI